MGEGEGAGGGMRERELNSPFFCSMRLNNPQ